MLGRDAALKVDLQNEATVPAGIPSARLVDDLLKVIGTKVAGSYLAQKPHHLLVQTLEAFGSYNDAGIVLGQRPLLVS